MDLRVDDGQPWDNAPTGRDLKHYEDAILLLFIVNATGWVKILLLSRIAVCNCGQFIGGMVLGIVTPSNLSCHNDRGSCGACVKANKTEFEEAKGEDGICQCLQGGTKILLEPKPLHLHIFALVRASGYDYVVRTQPRGSSEPAQQRPPKDQPRPLT